MYDIRFAVPVTPSVKVYRERIESMKKYGLVNNGNVRTLLTLIIEEEYTDTQDLTVGWESGIDVEVIKTPYKDAERKYAFFYLHVLPYSFAKSLWVARVDDDSATDIKWMYTNLLRYSPEDPIHLIARETTDNLRPHHRKLYAKYGFTYGEMEGFQHTWEVSVDSYGAISKLVGNPDVRSMYFDIMDWEAEDQPWADANYCYAMRMCGITPQHAQFLSKDPNAWKFSYFGGPLVHIHYMAEDLKEFRKNWDYFKAEVDKRRQQ